MAKKKPLPTDYKVESKIESTKAPVVSIVEEWKRKIQASRASEDRVGFMKTASMCHQFYAGAFAFMWEDKFRNEFLSKVPAPRFKVTIAKAFEMVAVMGPSIMWDYPGRVIKSLDKFKMPPEAFAQPELYEIYQQDFQAEELRDKMRNDLMSKYLNWSHREQPGGGMIIESHKAITEAIVKGRGVMFTDLYEHPSSTEDRPKKFTRSTWVSVDDLFIDPEARNGNLTDAYWIAIKRRDRYWVLEKRFNLPEGSLKDAATSESLTAAFVNDDKAAAAKRKSGLTSQVCDQVEWYEIYSKEGVGNRNKRFHGEDSTTIDEVVGDYAYLAICPKLDYPLNFPAKVSKKGKASKDEIRKAFDWPIPYWKDGRWPVSLLDFYTLPNSAWPIAPMAMGLGELVLLNVIISCLADRVYEGLRTFGLVSDQIADDILHKLKSIDYSGYTSVPDDLPRKIGEMIAYVQTPDVKYDVWQLIDRVSEMFDRRTGLVSRMYGEPNGQARSAAESEYQHAATNTRPDWMQRKAEEWLTDQANIERIAAGWGVEGQSLVPLLGSQGAEKWDELIADEDPEVFVLQMKATLEANSIKKPNKYRDNANLQQVSGYLIPMFDRYFQMTRDPGPINKLLGDIAEAMEQPRDSWQLGPLPEPEPDPAMQLEEESKREGLKGKQLRNQKLESEMAPPPPMPGSEPITMDGGVPVQYEPALQMPFPSPSELRPIDLGGM